VTAYVPALAKDVCSVAVPLLKAAVPRDVPFAEKATLPVGFVPNTDAVRVMDAFSFAEVADDCRVIELVRTGGADGAGFFWFSNPVRTALLVTKASKVWSLERAGALLFKRVSRTEPDDWPAPEKYVLGSAVKPPWPSPYDTESCEKPAGDE
jgi:hypothetical protein